MSDVYVYIIAKVVDQDADCKYGSPVKVGLTSNIRNRLDTIQTSTPFKVEIFQAFAFPDRDIARALEQAFHQVMKGKRLHGEWFDMTPQRATGAMVANVMAHLHLHTTLSDKERDEALARIMGFDPAEVIGELTH